MTVLGTFNSTTGMYSFEVDGHTKWFKPKYLANSGRMGIDEMKSILEAGHAQGLHENSYTKSILVASQVTWNSKIAGTPFAGTWGDLCWLHYWYPSSAYDKGYPAWAKTFNDYNHLLIKEYDDGKVIFWKNAIDLYAFFVDADTPVVVPPADPGELPITGKVISVDLHITGTITMK